VKVRIDEQRCQGHTVCNMIAPEIFSLREEDGRAVVVQAEVPLEHERVVIRAAANCPERAIAVAD
jgi:ferredoxin